MAIITEQQLEEAAVDCQTIEDVVNGSATFGPTNNGRFTSRLGTQLRTLQALANEISNNGPFSAPVDFASGISVTNYAQTVYHDFRLYAPRQGTLPFTTTGTFNPAQWYPLISSVIACSVLTVSPNGDDAQALSDSFQLGSGEWVYPTAFKTIIAATNASVVGDTINIVGSQYTESGALRGGRIYNFVHGCVLLNCVFTCAGLSTGGVLTIVGKPTFRRTSATGSSLTMTDCDYYLDLLDIDDQNLAASTIMVSAIRSWGRCNFRRISTVYFSAIVLDAIWNVTARNNYCYWEGEELISTNPAYSGSRVGVLFSVERGQKVNLNVKRAISANNCVFGIGALTDPASVLETRLTLFVGRAESAVEPVLFFGRATANDLHHLEIIAGSTFKTSATAFTTHLNSAGGMTFSVNGTAFSSHAKHVNITGPTYGTLEISALL